MADLFFYGTLRHLPLLEIVLGRGADTLDAEPAALAGHAVFSVTGEPFPTIVATPGASARGLLVRGLDDADVARLRYYEGGFDYDLLPVRVERESGGDAAAQVFFPAPGQSPTGLLWDFAGWAADWAAISERAAIEVMAWYGRKTPAQIAAAFPGIRRRAAAFVAAQRGLPDPAHDLARDVLVRAHRHAYANFFSMQEMDLQARQYDGAMGPVVNRAAVLVGQAAVVLPYDPVRDTVMLVEQFRAPVYIAGDPAPWVWEPIAGLLDPGETAETAARREAMEEAGLALRRLEKAGEVYSSTGSSTEYLFLFIGLADLRGEVAGTGGTDEGEDIRSKVIAFDDLMKGVDAGLYRDMPLVTTALWLSRHRDRLRGDG